MITTEFNEQSIVGHIVKRFPQAGDYFKSIKIDFCCGGNRTIIEAIEERKLNADEIMGNLEDLYQQAKSRNELGVDWEQSSCEKDAMQALVDEHDSAGDIIKRLREITNDFTPPEGACGTYQLVYKSLENIESDLFQHVHLENNILFPKCSKQLA